MVVVRTKDKAECMARCCAGRDCLLPPPPPPSSPRPFPPPQPTDGQVGVGVGGGGAKRPNATKREQDSLPSSFHGVINQRTAVGAASESLAMFTVLQVHYLWRPHRQLLQQGLSSPRVAHCDTKSQWSSLYFMLHNSSSGLGSASAISLNMDILRKLIGRYSYVLVV